MKTIWKYAVITTGDTEVEMLGLYKVLSAGIDPQGQLCVWALVEPDENWRKTVKVFVRGTGHPADGMIEEEGVIFLNTVFMGPLVWHVFYRIL